MDPETAIERDQRLEQFSGDPFAPMPKLAGGVGAERRDDGSAAPGDEAQWNSSAPSRREPVKQGLDDGAGSTEDSRHPLAGVGGELREEPKQILDMGRGENGPGGLNGASLAPIDVVEAAILNPPRDHKQHRD